MSIAPAGQICSGRGCLHHPVHKLGDKHLMVTESRDGVGLGMIAVPAVLGPVPVIHFSAVIRICRAFQKFFSQIDRIVQVIIIHVSAVDMDLSQKSGTQSIPIPLQDVAEIIIFPPVFGYFVVDLPRQFIPYRFGITILPHRRINRLPDVPLIPRTAFCRDSQFLVIGVFQSATDLSQPISLARPRRPFEKTVEKVGVLILIDVDQTVLAKIDRIGTSRITPVVFVGIKNLDPEGFPAAGGSPVKSACPALPHSAEFFLDVGNQLIGDGITVRSEIGRIDRIGVVIKGIGVLDLDNDDRGVSGAVHHS